MKHNLLFIEKIYKKTLFWRNQIKELKTWYAINDEKQKVLKDTSPLIVALDTNTNGMPFESRYENSKEGKSREFWNEIMEK